MVLGKIQRGAKPGSQLMAVGPGEGHPEAANLVARSSADLVRPEVKPLGVVAPPVSPRGLVPACPAMPDRAVECPKRWLVAHVACGCAGVGNGGGPQLAIGVTPKSHWGAAAAAAACCGCPCPAGSSG